MTVTPASTYLGAVNPCGFQTTFGFAVFVPDKQHDVLRHWKPVWCYCFETLPGLLQGLQCAVGNIQKGSTRLKEAQTNHNTPASLCQLSPASVPVLMQACMTEDPSHVTVH